MVSCYAPRPTPVILNEVKDLYDENALDNEILRLTTQNDTCWKRFIRFFSREGFYGTHY